LRGWWTAAATAVIFLAGTAQMAAPAAETQLSNVNQITFGVAWEPLGFYPLRALDSASYYAQTLVYEGLVKYGQDLAIEPALAKSFSVSADGLTYSFELRDGIKFCDGSAVTARDIITSIDVARSKLSPFKADYDAIDRVELQGGNRLVLHLSQVSAPFLSRLAELRILPARYFNSADHGKAALSRQPVGTGPFKLASWQSGLELCFVPNEYYWGRHPNFDKLVWRVVPDKSLLSMAIMRGELDVANIDAASWISMGGEQAAREHDLTLEKLRGSRTAYCGFNLRKKPFNDLLVREAIAHAIDRDEIVKGMYGGLALVPRTDVWPGSWAYNPDVKFWQFDRNLTDKCLRDAGYTLTNTGWRKEGQLLAFRIVTVKDFQDIAQVIADDLTRAHIPCEVQVLEYSSLRARYLQKGEFDVVVWSRSSGPDPECTMIWKTQGPLNFSGFSQPRVDELIELGKRSQKRADRITTYKEIQSILASELPWVFLAQPNLLLVHGDDIANTKQAHQELTGLPWDNPLFNAASWERKNNASQSP